MKKELSGVDFFEKERLTLALKITTEEVEKLRKEKEILERRLRIALSQLYEIETSKVSTTKNEQKITYCGGKLPVEQTGNRWGVVVKECPRCGKKIFDKFGMFDTEEEAEDYATKMHLCGFRLNSRPCKDCK